MKETYKSYLKIYKSYLKKIYKLYIWKIYKLYLKVTSGGYSLISTPSQVAATMRSGSRVSLEHLEAVIAKLIENKYTSIWGIPFLSLKGGWCYQNGWIFGKVPKRGGRGLIFNPRIHVADFGPLNMFFSEQNLQHDFPKMRISIDVYE